MVSIDLFGLPADATRTLLLERIDHALSNRAKPSAMMASRDADIEYQILDDDVFDLVNNDIGFEKLRAWAWMTERFPPE
ncbi:MULTISPECIES: hypothetical protein [unclassified Frankia]